MEYYVTFYISHSIQRKKMGAKFKNSFNAIAHKKQFRVHDRTTWWEKKKHTHEFMFKIQTTGIVSVLF